jgi:hypothetical protein
MVRIRLLWHMKEIYPGFYYESVKFIRVTYLVTLPNKRQCERFLNQMTLMKCSKLMLWCLMIMFMSLSLLLLALRLLTAHNRDLKNLILETSLFSVSVHIMMNETNYTQGP